MHALDSPHTLKFYDWYETRNNMWLILEYCTGGDLRSVIKQDSRPDTGMLRLFGLDLMTGLSYCHSRGVLYCDLKPSNVLIDEVRGDGGRFCYPPPFPPPLLTAPSAVRRPQAV